MNLVDKINNKSANIGIIGLGYVGLPLAVEFAKALCEVPVGQKFKTILTSAAGYPLDKTYYQTVKGMVAPIDILAEGGTLIIASECSEGFGSESFRLSQEKLYKLGLSNFLFRV